MTAFIKPEGNALTLVLRAPLTSLRDTDVPTEPNGSLNMAQVQAALMNAAQVWIRDFIAVFENGEPLPRPEFVDARISLFSDPPLTSFEQALAHATGGDAPAETQLYWAQGMIDVVYRYPIESQDSSFAIQPGLTALGLEVNIEMHYLTPDGVERVYDVHPEIGIVTLDPSVTQAATYFGKAGFNHVPGTTQLILLLLALALPVRRPLPLLAMGVAFAVGTAITFMAAGYDLMPRSLWYPYLGQLLIAVAIVAVVIENIIGARLRIRWGVGLVAGMIYGFGYAAIVDGRMQFAGAHELVSLVAFNVGLLVAELIVLAVIWVVLTVLFRFIAPARIGIILISALILNTAWDWMLARGTDVGQFPTLTLDSLVSTGFIWWLAALVVAIVVAALLSGGIRMSGGQSRPPLSGAQPAE